MRTRALVALAAAAGMAFLPVACAPGTPSTPAPAPAGGSMMEGSMMAGPGSSGATAAAPERAVQRDIRMTDMIQRAMAAGTRDSTGRPGANYWQTWMDYTIDARLDVPTSTVSGRETAVVHNNGPNPMQGLVLRLDQNIFRANVPRLETVTEITDGMQLTRLAVNGQEVDLANAGMRRRRNAPAPTAPIASDITQTSVQVLLPTPVAPGATATVEAEWSFQVARADNVRGLRMGRWDDSLYQVAQWYPRVAMYDDLRQGGWDLDPYLGPSEFYNPFGRFDVRIDVPAGWIVGSTGVLQNADEVLTAQARQRLGQVTAGNTTTIVGAQERGPGLSTAGGDRLVWHFVADTVGDVAWATSNQFVWDATKAEVAGRDPVPVNILYLPGDSARYARGPEVARHALGFYSRLWMPYTFPQLTIVDGPEGGMEYPMFIMSSVGAADHEIGHQWWPMMVGTNETWYGFMDEGFNQYMNILSDADAGGEAPRLDGLGQRYGAISGDEREAPLMWDANYGGPMYSFQAYSKAPLMLSMLGGIVGDSAVWRAMSGYAEAWRFKHPSPWDYAFYMSNALDRDLGWFWYYWLFTTDAVDGSIQNVSTQGARTTVTVRQDGEMPSPVVLQVRFAPTGPALQPMDNAEMVDARTAIVTYPVDVWFGGSRTFDAVLDFGGRTIESVMLDPHGRFPDGDPSDNVWPRGSGAN